MKAGDFTNRKARPKPTPEQVILGDTSTEAALRAELARLRHIESERDAWKTTAESNELEIVRLKESDRLQRNEIEAGSNKLYAAKENLSKAAPFEQKYLDSEEDLKRLAQEYAAYIDETSTIRTSNKELVIDLETVKGDLKVIEIERESMTSIISKLRGDNSRLTGAKDMLEARLPEIEEREASIALREKELKTENQLLAVEIETLTSQIKFYTELKTKFDEELDFATTELAKANTDLTRYRSRNTKLVSDVSERQQDLDDAQVLHEEMNQIIGVLEARMAVLRRKAETPVYMSMSMIEKMEGFKMPSNMIPIKNGLGTGTPTMFRKAV